MDSLGYTHTSGFDESTRSHVTAAVRIPKADARCIQETPKGMLQVDMTHNGAFAELPNGYFTTVGS